MMGTIIELYRTQVGTDPGRNAFVIALALFMVFGVCTIVYGIHLKMKLATAAESWPVARGTVVDSRINTFIKKDVGERPTRLRSAEIAFAYTVDGKEYISDKVHWGGTLRANFGNFIEKRLAKYPICKEIDVRYNPLNHADCVVELKFGVEESMPLLFGILSVLFPGVLLFAFIAPTPIKGLPIAYFFAIVCLYVFIKLVLPMYKNDARMPGSICTHAFVTSTEIQVANPQNKPITPESAIYFLKATYEYEVGDRKFSGMGVIGSVDTRDYIGKQQKGIPSGKRLRILVNPENHAESMLNPRELFIPIFCTVFLTLFIVVVPIAATRTCLRNF